MPVGKPPRPRSPDAVTSAIVAAAEARRATGPRSAHGHGRRALRVGTSRRVGRVWRLKKGGSSGLPMRLACARRETVRPDQVLHVARVDHGVTDAAVSVSTSTSGSSSKAPRLPFRTFRWRRSPRAPRPPALGDAIGADTTAAASPGTTRTVSVARPRGALPPPPAARASDGRHRHHIAVGSAEPVNNVTRPSGVVEDDRHAQAGLDFRGECVTARLAGLGAAEWQVVPRRPAAEIAIEGDHAASSARVMLRPPRPWARPPDRRSRTRPGRAGWHQRPPSPPARSQ
jgi:hypothetical protein